jgi:hypothetical protein
MPGRSGLTLQQNVFQPSVSTVWLGLASAMVPVQTANDFGVTRPELLSGAALFDCIATSETSAGGSWTRSVRCGRGDAALHHAVDRSRPSSDRRTWHSSGYKRR